MWARWAIIAVAALIAGRTARADEGVARRA